MLKLRWSMIENWPLRCVKDVVSLLLCCNSLDNY